MDPKVFLSQCILITVLKMLIVNRTTRASAVTMIGISGSLAHLVHLDPASTRRSTCKACSQLNVGLDRWDPDMKVALWLKPLTSSNVAKTFYQLIQD